jgi:hypothetical protein
LSRAERLWIDTRKSTLNVSVVPCAKEVWSRFNIPFFLGELLAHVVASNEPHRDGAAAGARNEFFAEGKIVF